jgi:hypothetical protein
MTIKRMDNAGIVVENMDAAITFFSELEGRMAVEGDWTERVTGLLRRPYTAQSMAPRHVFQARQGQRFKPGPRPGACAASPSACLRRTHPAARRAVLQKLSPFRQVASRR